MKQFWLCLFLTTSFFLYAEDAVTRATSYGSENVTVDTVTSATEYPGTPKVFKNEKVVDKQSKSNTVIPEEKPKTKPEAVLSERTDDEALRTESAMRFLPETFEQDLPAEPVEKKMPAVAVPYYQSYFTQASQLPVSKESIPAEICLGENSLSEMKNLPALYEKMPVEVSLSENYMREMKLLPVVFEKSQPTVVLADESSETSSEMKSLPALYEKMPAEVALSEDYLPEMQMLPEALEKLQPTVVLADESFETNSEMQELPALYEKMPAEVALSEDYLPEMQMLPEALEKLQPTVVLADESSEINSEMQELPALYEKMPVEVALSEDYLPEMQILPEALEKTQPTVVLADESSEINSEMQELPALYEKMPAEVALSEDYLPAMQMLPEALEKTQPTVVLADKSLESASIIGADMVELPLPEAVFENVEEKDEDLPFIWEEDIPEEEVIEEEFHDEDLPTLLDVPEVSLEDTENAELIDVPEVNSADVDVTAEDEEFAEVLPEENVREDIADDENVSSEDVVSSADSFEDVILNEDSSEHDLSKSDELMKEWKNEKDYRKLMDFNEEFNDFPETVEDILNNPAQYLYDSDELVVESGKKIDDLTGKKLFDSAVKCIKEKENEKAAKLLKELLHYNYSVPETEYLLALAEFKNGNVDCAMKYLRRSDRKNKNPYLIAKNSELKGEIYFSQNKYDKAYECFINAIIGVNSKQDAELYNKAGIAALRAGNIENARNAWKIGKYLGNRDAKRNLLWLDH